MLVPAALYVPGDGSGQRSARRPASATTGEVHRVDELLRRAERNQRAGQYRRALEDLYDALGLAESTGDRYRISVLSGSLGVAHLATGAREQARRALERSRDVARENGFPAIEAITLNNLGSLLAAGDEAAPALSAYDHAVRLALVTDQPALAARAAINAARLLARRGDRAAAEEHVEFALDQLEEASDDRQRALELVSVGLVLREIAVATGTADRKDALLAHRLFERAAAMAAARRDVRTQSYALGYLGRLYEDQGRVKEALRLTRRALFLAQTTDAPESLYLWQWQVGRLLAARGETDAAITAYEGAILTLQSIRRDFPAFDPATGRSVFRERVGPVFLELADLLLQRAADDESQTAQLQLRKARDVVEELKSAELEDYFRDDCVALLKSRTKGIDRLDQRSAVLYPIILPDRLELLLRLPDRLTRASVPVPEEDLTERARSFRRSLDDPRGSLGRGSRMLRHARKLHDWLIAPIEANLIAHGIDTLVFVPDGALRSIPLAAFHDGEEFVVSRYAVATAPGLELLDPRPLARTEIRPLLIGLTEKVQGFPPLPQVEAELQAIHAMYGGTMLKNEQFVTSRMEAALGETPYSVVHIASHAQFAGDPNQTFLLTYDGRLGMDKLDQLLDPSLFRDQPVELIALSACETAAGDDRAALGLAGVAIKAGARSALATLWLISDEASARLVAEFYRKLSDPAVSKAQALQQAQLALLEKEDYRHPYFWAPFLLIGNWL